MLNFLKLWWQAKHLRPAKFHTWIQLEELKEKIFRAITEKDNEFPDLVFSYLELALKVPKKVFAGKYWEEVIHLFYLVTFVNLPPKHLPIIFVKSELKKKKDAWDYQGRTWHLYSHLLSKTYGWTLEYIGKLSVEEAIAQIQEVLTDEQLEKEFLWSMSDKSYSYNPKTKTGKAIDLPRPYWMKEPPKSIQKTIMPVSMLPMGLINDEAIPPELKGKKVDTPRDVVGL